MSTHEIVQMPVKARVILERYANSDIRFESSISWTSIVTMPSDEEAIRRARDESIVNFANKIVHSLGKDNVIISVHNEFDAVKLYLRAIAFSPAKFEEMITDVYTAGLLEGRRSR